MSLVQVKEFWENCDLNFAHNTLEGHLPGYEKLVKSWEKDFIKKIGGQKLVDTSENFVESVLTKKYRNNEISTE